MKLTIILATALATLMLSAAVASAVAITLYASDAIGRDLYSINTLDGSVTLLGHHGVASGFCALEYSQRGDSILGLTRLTTAALYSIDPNTVSATYVGSLNIGYVYEGALAFDPTNGALYGANAGSDEHPQIFVVDPNSGVGTIVGEVAGAPHDFDGLIFDDDGQLYGLDGVTQALWKIDKNNPGGPGTQQVGAGLGAGIEMGAVGGITEGPDGVIYGYAADSHELFTVDLATGQATVLHSFGPDVPIFYGLTGGGAVSPVESTSWSRIKSMFSR
jgi:DNA-binding beta-propeller fold protein YncE